MAFLTLKKCILQLSVSKKFHRAKREWSLYKIVISKHFRNCACGCAIKDICYLKNKLNRNGIQVGNICARDRLNIGSDNFVNALKKIKKENSHEMNVMYIEGFRFRVIKHERLSWRVSRRFIAFARRDIRKTTWYSIWLIKHLFERSKSLFLEYNLNQNVRIVTE